MKKRKRNSSLAYYPFVKRTIDITGASLALLVLALPLAVCAVLIWINMGGPVVFRQIRAGRHCKDFVIYKFRTMTDDVDAEGNILPSSHRVTPLGRFLRKTSIDELPQLINVLKGDMSLVGPRPLLSSYIPFYSSREMKRFNVLPGITGLAQIEGRHNASWDIRLANDVSYVDNLSLHNDVIIVLRTIACVLGQRDVVVAPNEEAAHLHLARASNVANFSFRENRKQAASTAPDFEDAPALIKRRA